MKHLKPLTQNTLDYRKMVFLAVEDYVGANWGKNDKDILAKAIINRKFKELNDMDKIDALHIIANLADPTYRIALGESL